MRQFNCCYETVNWEVKRCIEDMEAILSEMLLRVNQCFVMHSFDIGISELRVASWKLSGVYLQPVLGKSRCSNETNQCLNSNHHEWDAVGDHLEQ